MTTLIHINKRNRGNQNLEKKIGDADEKNPDINGLVTATVLNTKTSEAENKISDNSSLVTTTVLNIKIREVGNKVPDHAKYIITQEFNKLTTKCLQLE